jgi:hypothetical protein
MNRILFLAIVSIFGQVAHADSIFDQLKSTGGIKVTDQGDHRFTVQINYGSSLEKDRTECDANRIVGEECKRQQLKFYDLAIDGPKEITGFCSSTPTKRGLGIQFEDSPSDEGASALKVSASTKKITHINKGDVIEKLNGRKIQTLSALKAELWKLRSDPRTEIDLTVERAGKRVEIHEPLILNENGFAKVSDIWAFNQCVKK